MSFAIDLKPVRSSLAGFHFADGFLMTRREYDTALDALFHGTAVQWSDLRAYVEIQRAKE